MARGGRGRRGGTSPRRPGRCPPPRPLVAHHAGGLLLGVRVPARPCSGAAAGCLHHNVAPRPPRPRAPATGLDRAGVEGHVGAAAPLRERQHVVTHVDPDHVRRRDAARPAWRSSPITPWPITARVASPAARDAGDRVGQRLQGGGVAVGDRVGIGISASRDERALGEQPGIAEPVIGPFCSRRGGRAGRASRCRRTRAARRAHRRSPTAGRRPRPARPRPRRSTRGRTAATGPRRAVACTRSSW